MRLRRPLLAISLFGVVVNGPANGAAASSGTACVPWSLVKSPLIDQAYLTSVDGVSSDDVWAVGGKSYGPSVPPILHWDGHSWKGARMQPVIASLHDVSADAVNDAWAVGPPETTTSTVVHWDGTTWRLQQSIDSDSLYGVVAISPLDVWAVGYDLHHWDGTTWSLAATSPGLLFDAAAVSSTDVWAVGYQGDRSSPLAEHWDGATWTSIPVPIPPGGGTNIMLNGVVAISTSDVWATGFYGIYLQPLIEHWDGLQWSIVSVPAPTGLGLGGVSAASASDAWTIGGWRTVSLHWDGSTWRSFPYHGPTQADLYSIAEISATDVWAVGTYVSGSYFEPLIEHSTGPCP